MVSPLSTLESMNLSPIHPVRDLVQTVGHQLTERREAAVTRRALERQLATYTTPREVDELLLLSKGADGPEVDLFRDVLLDNLSGRTR